MRGIASSCRHGRRLAVTFGRIIAVWRGRQVTGRGYLVVVLTWSKRLACGMAAVFFILPACADPLPTTGPPDSELRLQIHAATGHEPPECTYFGGREAIIQITADGFDPECAEVLLESVLSFVNTTEAEHRIFVGDPANSEVGRHIRIDETVGPGETYVLDPVDSLLDQEIYPFWSQGFQEDGFAGSLIVHP
jgi:hypothetical protein